jgi:hypothetical protein
MFPRRVRTARARRCPELEVDKAFSIPTGNIWKNPGFMPVKWDEHDETLWKTLVSWEKKHGLNDGTCWLNGMNKQSLEELFQRFY